MTHPIHGAMAVLALTLSSTSIAQESSWEEELKTPALEVPFRLDPRLYQNLVAPFVCTQTPRSVDVGANDCPLDPYGNTEACCYYFDPSKGNAVEGPACVQWGRGIQYFRQVGKGFCCYSLPIGSPFVREETPDQQPCGFCGGKNPTNDECCTIDYDVVPAYPVKDKSVCRDLRQDPDHQPSVTTPPCGSEDMIKQGKRLPPQSPTGAPFYIGCAAHDICYSTCGSVKTVCDNNFKINLDTICDDFFKPMLENASQEEADQLQFSWGYCKAFSWVYYEAVTMKGASAYDDAQATVCRCCIGGYNGPLP